MRRFISSILAVLVIVLSGFPCSDADEGGCAGSRTKQTILRAGGVDDNCPVHHDDLCSPFCTCSCCAGITIPEPIALNVPLSVAYARRLIAVHAPQTAVAVALPIWQPPKMV